MRRLNDGNFFEHVKKWLLDYLSDRRQFIKIGNTNSELIPVNRGILQGSIFGPFLFSIVTSTLNLGNDAHPLVLFADNVTLCVPLHKNSTNSHVINLHSKIVP